MTIEERTSIHLAELFSALSNPTRLLIISALLDHEMHVGEIAQSIGMSESAVSHQLRGLRQMRLIRPRKDGRQVYYCVDDEHVARLFQMGLEHVVHG
jgi:ArsR family transcriptional regulator, lead/cadmium/zinc/bismuth-responsive transcriptional repressor